MVRIVAAVGLVVCVLGLNGCGADVGAPTLTGAGTGGSATAGTSNGGAGKTQVGGTAATGGTNATGGYGMNGGSAATAGADPTGGTAADAGAGNVSDGGTGAQGGSSTGGDPSTGGAGVGEAGSGGEPAMDAPCGSVASGSQATRLRHRDLSVPYGTTCESEQQHATCTDGVLGAWSGSFVQETCGVLPPSDCEAAANGAYAERTRFEAASVAYGQNCKSEEQAALCTNGALGAWSGSFAFEACTVQPPANCGATPHGSYAKRSRYFNAEEPFGGSCSAEAQQALCNNGTLGAWSGVFSYDVCQVGPAASCDGVPHGKSEVRTRYEVTSVPYGETCPKEVQTHTCDNGFWSDWTGTYVYESCEVGQPSWCDSQYPHGTVQSYTAYAEYSVEFGESCLSEVRTRVCNNGAWSTWTGSYEAYTCSVQECAIGTTQTRSCGLNNRGTQSRSCLSGPQKGSWASTWDTCVDPDVCKDGAYVEPTTCNGGFGWEARTCVTGQYQLSGMCGSCSGTFVDPCPENKTAEACYAARYEGLSCYGGFFAAAPRCRFSSPFKTTCYDFHDSSICTPTFGCSWAWQ